MGGARGADVSSLPRDNEDWARRVERRLTKLERGLYPWQVTKGANGDLVAYNLATGQRSVIAELDIDDQPAEG